MQKNTGFSVKLGNYSFTDKKVENKQWNFHCGVKQISNDYQTMTQARNEQENVQAIKSTGRMPWHQEPTKDVTSCDKLRLAANKRQPADFRIGKPPW